jgi:hypothetical protein
MKRNLNMPKAEMILGLIERLRKTGALAYRHGHVAHAADLRLANVYLRNYCQLVLADEYAKADPREKRAILDEITQLREAQS